MIYLSLLSTINTSAINEDAFKFSSDLDIDFLEKNYSANLDLAASIFAHFNLTIKADLATLESCVHEKDYKEIVSITHKIKNNFIYVGASNLYKIIVQIEAEAKEENSSIAETYKMFLLNSNTTLKSITAQAKLLKEQLEK